MKNSYYENFGLGTLPDKSWLRRQELANLFKRPAKMSDRDSAHFNQTYQKDIEHQADLLFLPEDDGYKYALVVTDLATRLSDAEPLKTKESNEVKKAFKAIYRRHILDLPEMIKTDPGKEFHGAVQKYFEEENVSQKFGKAGRHRQLGMVERTNQFLAKAIFFRQAAQELLTDQVSKEWVQDLPRFIKAINKGRKRDPPKPAERYYVGKDTELIPIGTKVRAILDNPIGYVDEKRLHGKFRSTDIRWNPEIRTVGNIMLLPGKPPLYLLNDSKGKLDLSVAYPKKHLQIVPKGEEAPPSSMLRGKDSDRTYVVQKILDKKKIDGVWKYRIRWKGFDASYDTWEKKSNLFGANMPEMIAKFEKKFSQKN